MYKNYLKIFINYLRKWVISSSEHYSRTEDEIWEVELFVINCKISYNYKI